LLVIVRFHEGDDRPAGGFDAGVRARPFNWHIGMKYGIVCAMATPRRLTELDLRTALRAQLRPGLSAEAQIIEELGIEHGGARIDLAVVNGCLLGFEIKSDFDTLDRLAIQMHAYHRVFDELSIVTTAQFVEAVRQLLPAWWGIWQASVDADGAVSLQCVREASPNPRQDILSLLSLLWRDEAFALLQQHAGKAKSKLTRAQVYAQLAQVSDLATVRDWVSHALRHRTEWRTTPAVRSARPAVEPFVPSDDWQRLVAKS
jgi:hypothetical protein